MTLQILLSAGWANGFGVRSPLSIWTTSHRATIVSWRCRISISITNESSLKRDNANVKVSSRK